MNQEIESSKKKDKNRSYYEKNKERLLEKARQRREKAPSSPRVVSLFEPAPNSAVPSSDEPHNLPRAPWSMVGKAFLFVLVASMTTFLMHESAKFFFQSEGSQISAYLKAFVLESATVAFSLMKGRNLAFKLTYKLMVFLIYVYGIWIVSGPIVNSAIHQQNEAILCQKNVQELESEISQKEAIRDRYLTEGRITLVRKYDQSIDSLRSRLNQARKGWVQTPNPTLIRNVLWALIGFRILIMLSNFLCIQYLGREVLGKA